MNPPLLFPFADYWPFYGGFLVFVLALLALDLGVFHRHAHRVGPREAAVWSAIWISLALVFAYALHRYCHWAFPQDPRLAGFDAAELANQTTMEFLAGFLVEKALSVDNLFIFVVVFSFFAIPEKYQHRILFYGILGALVFRSIFIALGAVLMQYEWIILVFGVFLVLTGIKVILAPKKPIDPEKNLVVRWLSKRFPIARDVRDGRFFVRRDGRLHLTVFFLALCFIEISDVIFAVDSVPAIYAITREPLIVFTATVFAILGLRALYFLLADLVGRFHLLQYSLGAILIFVGLKMAWLNAAFSGKFPVAWSLGIIAGLLALGVIASWLIPPRVERRGS